MLKKFLILTFVLGLLVYCKPKKSKTPEEEPAETFDKQGLLTNIADNVIMPNYNGFKVSLDSLITTYNTFASSGSQSDFQIVKQKCHVAYLKYQYISLFEFGPAENIIVRANFNVFPTDTAEVKSNIASGTYNLSSAASVDSKGFPALDFLFYGNNQNENSIIQLFNTSSNRKQFVTDVLNDMSTKINSVISTWNSSYRSTFINSLGTDVGSSIGFFVNQINFELDYLKNAKIGTPLGKKTLGSPLPEKCEAVYGAQSVQYAQATLKSIEDAYLGRSRAGADGKGFDDYLDHLGAQYNNGSLNDAIKSQFALAKLKLSVISNPLSVQVVSNSTIVDAAYTEIVKLLVLLKTDMPSSLGVVISYQDGDGD